MRPRLFELFIAVALVAVLLVGCQPTLQPLESHTPESPTESAPTLVPTRVPPTATVSPTATVPPTAPAEGWVFPHSETLADFEAFRLHSRVSYSLGDASGAMGTDTEMTRDPTVRRTTTESLSRGNGDEEQHVSETVEAGDTIYMRVDDQPWVAVPAQQGSANVAEEWLGGFDPLFRTCTASYVGMADWEGTAVWEHALDADCIAESQEPALIRLAEGTIWVWPEHNLVVRATLFLQGSDTRGESLEYELVAEVRDVDTALAIAIPSP